MKRIYVQKNINPDQDIWLEVQNRDTGSPRINICGNGQNGKEIFLALSMSTMIRTCKAFDMIHQSIQPLEQNVWEETDAEVGNH